MILVAMEELFSCVDKNDTPEVIEHLLECHKIDINNCWKDDSSLLMVAAKRGHIDSVEKLIELGANVNAQSSTGKTALMEAAQKNQCEVIKALLANCAALRILDKDFWSAQSYASHFNHHKAEKLLDPTAIKMAELMQHEKTDKNRHAHKADAGHATTPKAKKVVSGTPAAPTTDSQPRTQEMKVLLAHHLATHHISPEVIALCEDKLVRQEGFGTVKIFARVSAYEFSRRYLKSLGIPGMGVQQIILDLHKECVKREEKKTNINASTTSTCGSSTGRVYTILDTYFEYVMISLFGLLILAVIVLMSVLSGMRTN